jgi:signal peptidase I
MKTYIPIALVASILLVSCEKSIVTMSFPSSSMEPTIPAGSTVSVDRKAYKDSNPKRYDLVTFVPSSSPDSEFVFRIIGLPDEKIDIEQSILKINGEKQTMPEGVLISSVDGKFNSLNLGHNEYFVLGDNSHNAFDSRFFGAIKRSSITGKIVLIEQGTSPNH